MKIKIHKIHAHLKIPGGSGVKWREEEEGRGEEANLGMGVRNVVRNNAVNTIAPISFKTSFTMKRYRDFERINLSQKNVCKENPKT